MKEIEEFLNFDQILKISIIPFFTFLFIILLYFLIWKRTKSTHSIMSRIWVIFNGKNKTNDIEINQILDSRSALMQFRFTTGIPIRLRTQINPLISWGYKNCEDLDDIARCGVLFDLEKPGLKKIKKNRKVIWSLTLLSLLSVVIYLMMYSILIATTNKAIVKIKFSDNLVLLGDDSANKITIFDLKSYSSLNKERCLNKEIERQSTELTNDEIGLLCESILKRNNSNLIKNNVNLQRIIFIPFSLLLAFFSIIIYNILSNIANSISMEKRLKERSITLNEPDYSI